MENDHILQLRLLSDECLRKDYDDLFTFYRESIKRLVKVGLLDKQEANTLIQNTKDYLLGIPEAVWRIEEQKDEDGWLANWLTRHPEFVKEDLEGQWPEWLTKPK